MSALRLARRAGAIVVLAIATAAIAAPTANKELAALFEREFKWALDEHPEFATFLGIDGYGGCAAAASTSPPWPRTCVASTRRTSPRRIASRAT